LPKDISNNDEEKEYNNKNPGEMDEFDE